MGDNLCDILFASLDNITLQKQDRHLKENIS